jgi:hypothetical protein
MPVTRSKRRAAIGALVVVAGILAMWCFRNGSGSETRRIARLSDGSTFEIRTITLAKNFRYSHEAGNRLQRMLSPITPIFIKQRFWPSPAGGFGFASDGNTNLFIITVGSSRAPNWWDAVGRLTVFDDQGNSYDACWGANTLGGPGEVVRGWQIRAFPRRSKLLGLRFLSQSPAGRWTIADEFKIQNPAYSEYPQWTPESLPITKQDGDLSVALTKFASGDFDRSGAGGDAIAISPTLSLTKLGRRDLDRSGGFAGDDEIAPRLTRLVFVPIDNHVPPNHWTVQKMTISDATGNRWSEFHSFRRTMITNCTVEFSGALWPGENAWKLDVEFVRTAGFNAQELWEAPPIQLPALGHLTDLTNAWHYDGVTVQLVALASPNTDHPGAFKWIAKWWGEDKNNVYSLALKLSPELKGRRLSVVKAVDQYGREAEIVQHGNEDYVEQAVFLKPLPETRELKLTFALQRSRFVQFVARPEFATSGSTNSAAKN